ncbi:MAG: fibronectin type III domain-containing protein [Paludibacteraceae bacterium]|nr:fibronectin type III domain-containing protein [Paludibacteraceae bacterium]
MRKCLLFVVLFVALTLNAQYRFAEIDFGEGLPQGWKQENTSRNDVWVQVDAGIGVAGMVKGSVSALVSNDIDLTNAVEPILEFEYINEQFDGLLNQLTVYYRTMNTDTTWSLLFGTDAREKYYKTESVKIPNLEGDSIIQLRLEVENRGGDVTAIKYLRIIETDFCVKSPTDLCTEKIGETTAVLKWTTADVAVRTRVVVAKEKAVLVDDLAVDKIIVDTLLLANQSANSLLIEGLNSSTEYYWYVQADCGYGDLSDWAEGLFTTLCAPQKIPLSDNFDSGLGCWQLRASGAYIPKISSNKSYSGNSSLYFQVPANNYIYAYSAKLDVDNISNLVISFNLYATDEVETKSKVTVGVITDLSDDKTFVPLYDVVPHERNVWQRMEVGFRDYIGDAYSQYGKYIVLRVGNGDVANSLYIDDIVIEERVCFAPQMVEVEDVTAMTAKASWVEMGESVSWKVRLSTKTLTDAQLALPSDDDIVVDTPQCLFTDLKPKTDYYVYVQSDCGAWSDNVVQFTTRDMWLIGYTDDFSSYDGKIPTEDWLGGFRYSATGEEGTTASYLPKINTSSSNNNGTDGIGALYLNNTVSYNPYIIFPEINVDRIQDVQFEFYAKMASDIQGMVISVCDKLDLSTAVPVDTIYPGEEGVYERHIITFENYKGDGKHIAISAKMTERAEESNGCYFDNFRVDSLQICNPPQGVRVIDIKAESAVIRWNNAKVNNWKVLLYDEEPTTASIPLFEAKVDTSVCLLSNLASGTDYYVYVVANCGDEGYSDYSTICKFTTLHVIGVPYYNDFSKEPIGSGTKPNGWEAYNEATSSAMYIPYVNNKDWSVADGYVLSSDIQKPSLYFNTLNRLFPVYAVMPYLADSVDIRELFLSCYLHYNATFTNTIRDIDVGVMSDPENPKTFVPVATMHIENPKVPQPCYVSFAGYAGSGRYIAFRCGNATSTAQLYLDNLMIDYVTGCAKVTNVDIESLTNNSADITWVNGSSEKQWNVKVFDRQVFDAEIDTITECLLNKTIDSKPLKLSGLKPLTDYWVAIQAKTDSCVGDWSNVFEFRTACPDTYSVPFLDTFNEYEAGETLECYISKAGLRQSYLPVTVKSSSSYPDYENGFETFATAKGNTVKLYGDDEYYTYLILPEFDKSIIGLQLSFFGFGFSDSYPAFVEVGVMEDVDSTFFNPDIFAVDAPTNDALFSLVKRIELSTRKEWEYCMVQFDSYRGKGKRIALRTGGHSAWLDKVSDDAIYIDHLLVEELPPCSKILDADITSITTDKATLTWQARDEKSWNIKVATVAINPLIEQGNIFDGVITECPYNITNLQPNTRYYVYIQRVNDIAGCVGEWSDAVAFNTECVSFEVGFIDDFESNIDVYGKGVEPRCWTILGTDPVGSYVEKIVAQSGMGKSPTKEDKMCMTLLNSSKYDHDLGQNVIYTSYAVLPELKVSDIRDIQLRFKAYHNSSSAGQFEVGVLTDLSDMSTYRAVYSDTIEPGAWNEYLVNFVDYKGDDYGDRGTYIVLRALPGLNTIYPERLSENKFYIDSVVVEEYKVCEEPIELSVKELGETTATIGWLKRTETHWNMKVSDKFMISDEAEGWLFNKEINNCPYEITGLKPNTTYYVYVQRIDSVSGCVGSWSDVLSFTTNCAPIGVDFFDDFESNVNNSGVGSVPRCWTVLGDDPMGAYVYQYTSSGVAGREPQEGDYMCLVMNNNSTYNSDSLVNVEYSTYVVLPELSNYSVEQVQLRFQAYTPILTGGQLEVGVISNINDWKTYNPLYVDRIPVDEEKNNEWFEFIINFLDYKGDIYGDAGNRIVLRALPGRNIAYPDRFASNIIYIDSVYVEPYQSCVKPLRLNVAEVGVDYATLNWKSSGNRFNLVVATELDMNQNSIVIDTVVEGTSVTIKGLPTNKYQYFKVRMMCDNEESVWSDVETFRTTGCDNKLPYVEGFEGLPLEMIVPSCYNAYNAYSAISYGMEGMISYYKERTYTYASACVIDKNAYSGNNALAIGANISYNGYAFLPQFDVDDLSKLTLSLKAYIPDDCQFEVGVIDNVNDIRTYRALKLYKASSNGDYSEVLVDFSHFSDLSPKARIALRALGSVSTSALVYVDDIKVDYTDQGLWYPIDVVVDNVTHNSASLSWSEVGAVDGYQLAVVRRGEKITDKTTLISVSDEHCILTNLSQNTIYDIYLRSKRGGSVSQWSEPYLIYVFVEPTQLPYTTTFNNDVDNAKWIFVNTDREGNVYADKWTIGSAVAYGETDNMSLQINSDVTIDAEDKQDSYVWAYRSFKVDNPGIYDIELMVQTNSGDWSDFLSVAFMPAEYLPAVGGDCVNIYDGDVMSHTLSNEYIIVDKSFTAETWTKVKGQVRVDVAGYYNLLCYWYDYAKSSVMTPAAIDDLTISKASCIGVYDLHVEQLFDKKAVVEWYGLSNQKWHLIVSNIATDNPDALTEEQILVNTELAQTSYQLLTEPNSAYYVYVRPLCDVESDFEMVEFTTRCEADGLPYIESFPNESGSDVSCWTTTDGSKLSSTIQNTEGVVAFGSSKSIVMPLFTTDLNNLNIEFVASHAAYNMAPTIFEMGVLSNPLDMSTYEKLLDVRTPGEFSDVRDIVWGEYYFDFKDYKGDGKYIVFTALQGTFYLNDVKVDITPECSQPFDLYVSDVSSSSALLEWKSSGNPKEWIVKVVDAKMTDAELESIEVPLFCDTIETTSVVMSNLPHTTSMFAYVKAVCESDGNWSLGYNFTTLPAPIMMPYFENFDDVEDDMLPVAWSRYDNSYSRLLQGRQLRFIEPTNYYYDYFSVDNNSLHSSVNYISSAFDPTYRWVVSPEIVIDQCAVLSFDMRFEKYRNYAINDKNVKENRESYIRVLISTDNGKTWPQEQSILIGDDSNADYSFNQFMEQWDKVVVDLSQYKGDTIKFAFYIESIDRAELYVDFDNVAVKCASVYEVEDVAFEKRDYIANGFNLDYSCMLPGEHVFIRLAENQDDMQCDSIISLRLNVLPISRTNIDDKMCPEDELYVDNGFYVFESGEYRQRYILDSGADSIVTLTLGLFEGETEFAISETIKEGEFFPFGGENLTETGVYTDSLVNQYGCDSVVVLTLTVEPGSGVALDNTMFTELVLTPNPVAVGEELYISAEFTAEELEGMTIEVFNATGQCVYRTESAQLSVVNSQFAITGLPQAGVYMVNITTSAGSRYQGKVIVR